MTKGQRIKSKREELNISQTEFAKKIDVSKQTLYKYENDIVTNIPSNKLEKIAIALHVDPSYLMGWETKDIIDAYIHSDRDKAVLLDTMVKEKKKQEEKAKELYSLYEQASPEVQSAVELLLRSAQYAPESQSKN